MDSRTTFDQAGKIAELEGSVSRTSRDAFIVEHGNIPGNRARTKCLSRCWGKRAKERWQDPFKHPVNRPRGPTRMLPEEYDRDLR